MIGCGPFTSLPQDPSKNRPECRCQVQYVILYHDRIASTFVNMGNPRVFFDITIDGANAGRIVMEVRDFLLSFILSLRVQELQLRHLLRSRLNFIPNSLMRFKTSLLFFFFLTLVKANACRCQCCRQVTI